MKVLVFLCVVGAAFAVRDPVVHTCLEGADPGPCLAYVPSFYYDPHTAECKPFVYGGCQGNGNRYRTEQECLDHCSGVQVKQEAPDVCLLDKKPGMCEAYMPRYYYDRETGQCTKFIYGGCQGNGNNFYTQKECEATCKDVQDAPDRPDCDKAPETGMCKAYIPRFYYDQEEGMCKKFIYGGCGGNRNNFKTEDECNNKCGAARAPSKCSLEPKTGPCRGYFPMIYFDSKDGVCKSFIYGGCGGNENRFDTEEECEEACKA